MKNKIICGLFGHNMEYEVLSEKNDNIYKCRRCGHRQWGDKIDYSPNGLIIVVAITGIAEAICMYLSGSS